MTSTPPFDELLSLIEDRSAALRHAAASVPDLQGRVPGCPDWTLDDLVFHLSTVQRFWAAAVSLANDSGPPPPEQRGEAEPPGDILEWFGESTGLLLAALRAVGPDSPCWAWWAASGAPLTAGAVARHQVQEAAVHARDAQEAIGKPEPLPAVVAVDGVAEFLSVGLASQGAWPHRPARVAFAAVDGPTHVVDLSRSGVILDQAAPGSPVVTVHAPASDLVLALYGRLPFSAARIEGDEQVLADLLAWGDSE